MSEPVVVDTNILVRAFLSGKKEEDNVLRYATSKGRQLVYGQGQLKEFVEVLGYKRIKNRYPINHEEVKRFGRWLMEKEEVEPEIATICRDPDDNYVIGLALRAAKKGKAYLVKADKDILELKGKINQVEILTPGEFLLK